MSLIWSISRHELKKVLPLAGMMFCIIFIYSLCRDLKDTLVVSKAIGGGAETLGFIKIVMVMPAAVLFMWALVKLSNSYTRATTFHILIGIFWLFFLAFGFIIYPHASSLHLSSETIGTLQRQLPSLHWLWPAVGNWSFSLFYIMAEMWGSVILSALFWQLANEFTTVNEAKRVYSFFGFIGNFGLMAAGLTIIICANLAKTRQILAPLCDPFLRNIKYQMSVVLFFGLLLHVLLWYFYRHNQQSPALNVAARAASKKKYRLNFGQSIKYVLTSKYLLMIAVMVMAYGVAMSLLEFMWKGQVKLFYPDTNDFHAIMGQLSVTTSIVAIIAMVAGSYVLQRCSWRFAALITPFFLLLSSALFFLVIMYENRAGITANICGYSVVLLAVVVGLYREAISKGVKYSLFDSTKQMAYIPLDPEIKTKGQAAVEIIGGRAGKIGGSAIQSSILMMLGGGVSLASQIEVLGLIVLVIVMFWCMAVLSLSKQFEQICD